MLVKELYSNHFKLLYLCPLFAVAASLGVRMICDILISQFNKMINLHNVLIVASTRCPCRRLRHGDFDCLTTNEDTDGATTTRLLCQRMLARAVLIGHIAL